MWHQRRVGRGAVEQGLARVARHVMLVGCHSNQDKRVQNAVDDVVGKCLADIARHVIGRQLTQQTRVQNERDDLGGQYVPGPTVEVPQTSRAAVVETRNVTRFSFGTSHALGVRWLFPKPFQKMPRCRAWQILLATSSTTLQTLVPE